MEKVTELRNRFKDHLNKNGEFVDGSYIYVEAEEIRSAGDEAILVGTSEVYFNDHYDSFMDHNIYYLAGRLVTSDCHWNFYGR